ncbi:ATP-dependent RNA helicase [Orobanche minor]
MSRFWKPGTEKPRLVEDEEGGVLLLSASVASSSGYGHASLEKQRQRLPVHKYRTAILYLVETHATTIIVGETGSGKTTQIPQYLKEAGWADGGRMIACTQPRRLAVQTVASRVSEEMGVALGDEVGYTIRFEDITNPELTRIKFLTDGVLLREMMDDPLLSKYSVIMVDEAHERSLSTDILLGLLKKIQRRRPELRLIISSATIEAKSMASFFNTRRWEPESPWRQGRDEHGPRKEPAILSVEGRGFNVEIFYVEEPVSDYIRAAVSTVVSVHDEEPMGDILVFLTGQDDIDAAIQLLTEDSDSRKKGTWVHQSAPQCSPRMPLQTLITTSPKAPNPILFHQILTVFGVRPGFFTSIHTWIDSLASVFRVASCRSGSCVFPNTSWEEKGSDINKYCRDIIDTGGVVYVVDCGFSKQRFYNPVTDIENLIVAPISKASARQRAGRSGRVRPGKCYRLYTEEYFMNEMSADGTPEMQRSNLVSCVIQLKALGIDNILGFDWPASPSPEALIRALEVLYSLGVIDDDAKLTSPAGFQVAEIPLDPMISKMILASNNYGCSEEVITIAAVLSIQSIWFSVRGAQKELDEAKLRFAAAEGDHVTFLNVYKGFTKSGRSSNWCHKNHINYHAMKKVDEIRQQLRRIVQRLGITLKSCEGDMQVVRKAVTAGFFANACRLEAFSHNGLYKTIRSSQEVYIHPSSVLFRVDPKWVIFHSIVSTDRQYMRNVISIDPSWLTEVAPQFYQHHRINPRPFVDMNS